MDLWSFYKHEFLDLLKNIEAVKNYLLSINLNGQKSNDYNAFCQIIFCNKDCKKRLQTYNRGLANDLAILFELEVDDIKVVESCAKLYLKKYRHKKRRKVYDVNLEIISGMLERCDIFTKATEKFFESHKKEFKKGAQRMKNKKGEFYLFFVENK